MWYELLARHPVKPPFRRRWGAASRARFDVEARSHTQRQVLAQSFIGRHGIGVVSQRW